MPAAESAARLRVVRRPRRPPAPALTAASVPITDPRADMRKTLGGSTRGTGLGGVADWQSEAWDCYDTVGELAYVVDWVASNASRVRLVASEIGDDGMPTGGLSPDDDGNFTAEQQIVIDLVRRIAGGPLGQAALQRRSAENLYMAGEHYLAVLAKADNDTGDDIWLVLSPSDILTVGSDTDIHLPDGSKHRFRRNTDTLIRVWSPHARNPRAATSPVLASLDALREVRRTSRKIKQAATSRLIGGGVWLLPDEMQLPTAAPGLVPVDSTDPAAAPPLGVPAVVNKPQGLADLIFAAATAALADDNAAAAHIPIMVTAPAEALKAATKLDLTRDVTDVELKTREAAIGRLAMGLSISRERMLGLSQGNHWSVHAIGDDDVQTHIRPVVETLVGAINDRIFRPLLRRANIDPNRFMLWYSVDALTADPDRGDEAEKAADRGAIRHDAYRRYLHLDEADGYDLSNLEGAQAWARDAVVNDPSLLRELLPLLPVEVAALDFPAPAALPPGPPTDEPVVVDADGTDEPGTETDDEPA